MVGSDTKTVKDLHDIFTKDRQHIDDRLKEVEKEVKQDTTLYKETFDVVKDLIEKMDLFIRSASPQGQSIIHDSCGHSDGPSPDNQPVLGSFSHPQGQSTIHDWIFPNLTEITLAAGSKNAIDISSYTTLKNIVR